MLRKISPEEFDRYVEFAYRLTTDLSCSGFPIYADGIKTRDDFYDRSRAGLERETEEILLYETDGGVNGWIHYYFIEEDNYIGICSILIRAGFEGAMEELFAHWETILPGFTYSFYFPEENKAALSFFRKHGFDCESREIVEVLRFEDYDFRGESPEVVPVGAGNFHIFEEIHKNYEQDMYWTGERIKADLEDWEIFVYRKEDRCCGTIYYNGKGRKNLEIFGIDADGKYKPAVIEGLLISCLNSGKRNGADSMYFFTNERYAGIAEKLCFRRVTAAYYFEGNGFRA